MTSTGDRRGHWASSPGFVLAAAGSAVRLGNLWRFPYITGENGAYLVDERGWSRRRATVATGGTIALLTVPAALTGWSDLLGSRMQRLVGKNWFDLVLDTVSDLMLPIGGLGFAIFVAWRLRDVTRRGQFPIGMAGALYRGWLTVLRYFVPLAVALVFLHAVGVL